VAPAGRGGEVLDVGDGGVVIEGNQIFLLILGVVTQTFADHDLDGFAHVIFNGGFHLDVLQDRLAGVPALAHGVALETVLLDLSELVVFVADDIVILPHIGEHQADDQAQEGPVPTFEIFDLHKCAPLSLASPYNTRRKAES